MKYKQGQHGIENERRYVQQYKDKLATAKLQLANIKARVKDPQQAERRRKLEQAKLAYSMGAKEDAFLKAEVAKEAVVSAEIDVQLAALKTDKKESAFRHSNTVRVAAYRVDWSRLFKTPLDAFYVWTSYFEEKI